MGLTLHYVNTSTIVGKTLSAGVWKKKNTPLTDKIAGVDSAMSGVDALLLT